MIKARPAAGDLELGARFLADLAPFIWRKYFDYAAIADIHAMKRQIHAVRGHEQVTVPGHDVKLGRGGIREIEFFVQTQQLIFGGRRPTMRGARTLDMLRQLHAEHWVGAEAVADLSDAYVVPAPHRAPPADGRRRADAAPAVRDRRRSRASPNSAATRASTRFSAETDRAICSGSRNITRGCSRTRRRSTSRRAASSSPASSTIPRRLTTLRRLGFQRPETAAETIRGWHFGRRSAVQQRARARSADRTDRRRCSRPFPVRAIPTRRSRAFDAALARMPGAVELLSILRSNAPVRELFGDLLGGAPRLAQVVAARPHVLDAAIDPGRARAIGESLDEARHGGAGRRLPRRRRRASRTCSTARATSPPRRCS